MTLEITKMSISKTCKDCPVKPLNIIKAEIEQKRSKWNDDGDSSCLVRAGIDVALRVIDKYM